jgi:hypothetical protein
MYLESFISHPDPGKQFSGLWYVDPDRCEP